MHRLNNKGDSKTATQAIILRDGKVLCGLRNYTDDKYKNISVWTCPGGRCDEGETIEQTLKRETEEEVGINDLKIEKFLGEVKGVYKDDKVLVYLCSSKQEAKLMEPEKFSEWKWFNPEEIPENYINEEVRRLIRLENMINLATSRMSSAYFSYFVWKYIESSRNTNEAGAEKANRFVSIMGKYGYTFHSILRGSFYVFVIDLSIFFDKQNPSLNLKKIIDLLNPSEEDLKEINKLIDSQRANIKYLKDVRDKTIAHLDLNVDRSTFNSIIFKDTEELFDAVQKILNIITRTFNSSPWMWDIAENEVKHSMSWFIENLERGESKRIQDINAT
ncbi:MAG: hypothetical protein A3A96_04115 [Candidatus Zambryskibacteria bacterium RIFCSPLOWO2_01_FULL_39_39]|uniref:Nudix hydrolase domain-containing protein n=1 Tax=Candidatus Zambryskibacteria bacterium RIFCSPLOWO2_01_FULL_39_39 TaxID=1802758 RepID=A0A1G2TWQ0_9BACT|nr:MAG: Orotate phosphoribosyltransferase [Parcubacteria group bacterium GW2011_GWA1_38_7]OHA87315.1 MAG: hypothetical protein A2644_03740 [Candidatus Zambryskibacteria bacterium RIFCSPHIGHO2_01_FULL_39_63]OHA95290.1 MAG: hypothetical protein A3B88_02280 [Candidatus Zambryskibacteria bacterium RIFCSPHIGHO2_02_FULL_39_19]OHA98868.1 MAG: hypothetical protein A3F20_02375 [Candidatus Zambryskibacteria bacterium RIFCSPHIGHO2_12_FULL_39_21]OHB01721.1 MAG: hypothetical protein A3A96_04115 [Candidatus 